MQERGETFLLHGLRGGVENNPSSAIALEGAYHGKCILCRVEKCYFATGGVANQDVAYPGFDFATVLENQRKFDAITQNHFKHRREPATVMSQISDHSDKALTRFERPAQSLPWTLGICGLI